MPVHLEIVRLSSVPDAADFLQDREATAHGRLKVEKRRRQWLGGRWAAKSALLAAAGGGIRLEHKDIAVVTNKDGKPQLRVKEALSGLSLSISHSGDYAAAALSRRGGLAVGVDIEKIEERPQSWMRECFHPAEITDETPQFLTALWTKKEAVLKFLGLGLSVDLWSVRFCAADAPVLYSSALARWKELGGPVIKVETFIRPEGYVTSVATGETNGRFN